MVVGVVRLVGCSPPPDDATEDGSAGAERWPERDETVRVPAGAVLVHYSGTARTQEEFDAVYSDQQRMLNGYVFLMWRRIQNGGAEKAAGPTSAIYLDAYDGGNTGCMVNDFRQNPLDDAATADLLQRQREAAGGATVVVTPSRNVRFVRVHHRGWPFLFIVAVRDLFEGEELLLDYGEAYWECRRDAHLSARQTVPVAEG